MDSNIGSQDKETIAKYLEDSVELSESKDNNGMVSRVVGNIDIYQSQPNNNEICILKNSVTTKVDRGRKQSILGGIEDTKHNTKKRGYDELMVQT